MALWVAMAAGLGALIGRVPTLERIRTSCFIKRPDPLLQRGCGQADQARTTIYHRVSQERTDLVAFPVMN